ncbi:uncharacterized protein V6R79_006802 [Siganus canaliculatus]
MEEYLRKVQSRLREDASEGPIHAVLGGPEPDVDTVAATLCLALHLSQNDPSCAVCMPVLSGLRCDAVLPGETVRYLQRVKICERSLLWRDDVDLVKLHHTGKLSLTLLRDGLLDSSEYHTLESSILRVVHHDGQRDTRDDGASSAVKTVAREILQEAAEHIGAALGETLGEALRLQSEDLWSKHGHRSTQLDELMRSLEQRSGIAVGQHDEAKLQDLEQLLTMKLKDFSDGEMTIALTSVTTDKEDFYNNEEGLRLFGERHGYDGLVILSSITDALHRPRQQVAVYSNNTGLLDQICCELEESSSWSLSSEQETRESLQVYYIPINTSSSSDAAPLIAEEIQSLLKGFVDRRSSVLACHPSSRTSSTEGVAGSVEFSQGSSGINDMDGSDVERTDGAGGDVVAIARVTTDGEEDTGAGGVVAGGELVSPDSGMTTIRSSRSSKESSVFLSDDSPVGEITAAGGAATGPGGLLFRNPSPLGLLTLSPPVPPERRKHRSSRIKSDTIDLFSFDPLHGSDHTMQVGGDSVHPGVRRDAAAKRAESSSFSELEELSLLDFSASNSLGRLESTNSSIDHYVQHHGNDMTDTMVPPTPVNSVVGSRPPSSCGVRFFPEDVVERISGLQHKDSMSSSLSETWDELGFETPGALSSSDNNTWTKPKESESSQNVTDVVTGNESVDKLTEQASREGIAQSEHLPQKPKVLEPQLSLITEQTESHDNWNPDSIFKDQWNPVTVASLQLTPPEEETTGKFSIGIATGREKTSSLQKKKAIINTLTPDTSKEEDDGQQGKRVNRQIQPLDFWTYTAQKGLLKSDSETSASYPESFGMWNMTIRDDSLSPLTTPDNLSETSASLCGVNPNVGANLSVESPPGFSDDGMMMWNTTIREESSSTIASTEGPENEKDLSHTGSLDAGDSVETHLSKQDEEDDAVKDESSMHKVFSPTPKEEGWKANEHNVKIVIEMAEGKPQGEDDDDEILSVHNQDSVLQDLGSEHSESGSSQYYNTDMWNIPVTGMATSTSEYDNVGAGTWSLTSSPETYSSSAVDMIQLDGQSSPFIALSKPIPEDDKHTPNQRDDSLEKSESRASTEKQHPAKQVFLFEGANELSPIIRSRGSSTESKYDNRSVEESEEADWMEEASDHSPFVLVDFTTQDPSAYDAQTGKTGQSTFLSLDTGDSCVSKTYDGSESLSSADDLLISLSHSGDRNATESKAGGKTLSLSLSSELERNTQKISPDSLHPGSRDEFKSNSDSSSGLEMESIIVSGTVKEAETDWHSSATHGDRNQAKGTRKAMETFSTLTYAVSVLQAHAQAAQRQQGNTEKNRQKITEFITASQSKPKSEEFHQSNSRPTSCSQTQSDDEKYDDKSDAVSNSVSPSLRYSSDHFLKTREEIYVHSQISMEDSDEGEPSPSARQCPASLENLQMWTDQLERQETPQPTSEPQSPAFTNSSVSHTSSLVSTPHSESGAAADRRLGLPFSGDLMEEENDEEEETNTEHTQNDREDGTQHLGSSDLLSFTEELVGGASFHQTGSQTPDQQNTLEYYGEQSTWSMDQPREDHEASRENRSSIFSYQDVPSDFSSQRSNENAAYQWTGSLDVTQGQTQYGYNYHHIDQRTENQSSYPVCYSLEDPGSKFQHITENQYGPDSMTSSELQCSQYHADGQSHEFPPFYSSDAHHEREDHARYVPEEYAHFLVERHSQQGEGAAGMMEMASNEEAADEMDNREDPSSSADLSGGSHPRRKLSAPPMNVSLNRSEGSLLSEDALDTEDEALDTADDLDVDIDELDTSDEADSHDHSEESNLGAEAASGDATAGCTTAEGGRDSRLWRSVVIGEQEHRIDMKCIDPYKRVISHGGYYAEHNAIIVFAACFLPDSNCENYNYVMENLFLYVISTLELMVAEDYMIVYLNGATPRRRMPGFTWMKKCYQMIDRRLKKNLKMFIIVHPSWFIRTLLGITRPFISSKFSSKIKYVHSLQELGAIIPMEYVHIPPSIVKYDEEKGKHKFACMRLDTEMQHTGEIADKKRNSVV